MKVTKRVLFRRCSDVFIHRKMGIHEVIIMLQAPMGSPLPIWPYARPTYVDTTPNSANVLAKPNANTTALHYGILKLDICVE